ncbi:MAG: BPSS1780 family membrane protein [Sulfuriferula sp.]
MTPRTVPASHGWQWIKSAFGIFKQSYLLWIVLSLAIILIGAVLMSVPVIGGLIFTLIYPALIAGLLLGCHAQQQGEKPEISHLFAAFKTHGTQLITVGGIYLTGMLIIGLIVGQLGGEGLIRDLTAGHSNAETLALLANYRVPILISVTLQLLLISTYWFAPALIVFGNLTPINAMKASSIAILSNAGAFLVYGFSLFVLFFLATLPLIGLIVMIPIAFITYYTAFMDVFGGDVDKV